MGALVCVNHFFYIAVTFYFFLFFVNFFVDFVQFFYFLGFAARYTASPVATKSMPKRFHGGSVTDIRNLIGI